MTIFDEKSSIEKVNDNIKGIKKIIKLLKIKRKYSQWVPIKIYNYANSLYLLTGKIHLKTGRIKFKTIKINKYIYSTNFVDLDLINMFKPDDQLNNLLKKIKYIE